MKGWNEMDIASGLACRLARAWSALGPLGGLALLATLAATGVVIGDHLLPTTEPIVMAPLRWTF